RPRRDRRLQAQWVHVVGEWIDIHEHRPRATVANRIRRSDEGVTDRDNFIARSNPQGGKGHVKRARAARNGTSIGSTYILCKFVLERLHARALGHPARGDGLAYGDGFFLTERGLS